MATIGSMAISVRAQTEKLKQDLKPALDAIKDWGAAAKSAGVEAGEVDKAMARMRAEAMRGGEQGKKAGASIEDGLKRGKTAAAALTGAISAMSSELQGTVGVALRLSTSLTQSFLAGGPIALGVTALGAAFSALAGSAGEAAKEMARSRQEAENFVRAGKQSIENDIEAAQALKDKMREQRGEESAGFAEEQAIRRRYAARLKAVDEGIATERQKIEQWNRERADIESAFQSYRGLSASEDASEEVKKRDQWIADAKARLAAYEQMREAQRNLAATQLESLNLSKSKTEADAAAVALAEKVKAVHDGIASIQDGVVRRASEWAEAQGRVAEQAERGRLAMLEMADKARGWRDTQNQTYWDSLVKGAEAGNLRISKLQNERAKAQKENARLAQQASEAMQVDHTALGMAQQREEIEKRITAEKQAQTAAVRQQLDITKRFANFGGAANGVFGFGAGAAGFSWGGQQAQRRKAPGAGAQGKGGSGAFDPKPLQDTAAAADATAKALQALPPMFQRVADAAKSMATAAATAGDRMARTTVRVVADLASAEHALEKRVDRFERDLARAGALGIGE